MDARTGKIARLPLKIREELNRRLLDGESGGKILPWLNAEPAVKKILGEDFEGLAVNDNNLSAWRAGGHQDWLKQREKIARTRELAEYAAQQSQAGGATIADGAAAIASGKLLELLEVVDEATGEKLSSESLVNISRALAALRTTEQNDVKLGIAKKQLKQKDRQIDLDEQIFRRETAAIALKVLSDDRAKSIEAGTGTNAEKIDLMGNHLFGDLWTKAKTLRDQREVGSKQAGPAPQ